MGTLVNGIKEIFATSQSTATHVPVCASDGTPQGRISVGDLASVLGGMKIKDAQGLDLNNVTDTGAYTTSSTTQNQPTTYATIIVYNSGGNVVQTAYNIFGAEYGSNPHIWSRIRVNGTWTSWISINDDIPTFYKNYNSLSTLLAALSNLESGNVYDAGTLDSVTTRGLWYGGDGFIFVLNHANYPNISWQIMIEWQGGMGVKIRRTNNTGSSWSSWYAFSLSQE